MSHEAVCSLRNPVRPDAVFACLAESGYERVAATPFWNGDRALRAFSWFDHNDYRSHRGVYVEVARRDQSLQVYLRSNISASYWDLLKLNETIRTLRRRFGGGFRSDYGASRYFQLPDKQGPSESGCSLAFERFEASVSRAELYLANRRFPDQFRDFPFADLLAAYSPWVLSNNLLLPFVVSILEDYFKSTFVAVLKHSARKESIFKSARLSSQQLLRLSAGKASVEALVAEGMAFQNLRMVSEAFRNLVPGLDIHGILRRPYRRRRISLWEALNELVENRHAFVHRGEVDLQFDDEVLATRIVDTQVAVDRVYRRLCHVLGWPAPERRRYRRPIMALPVQPDVPGA